MIDRIARPKVMPGRHTNSYIYTRLRLIHCSLPVEVHVPSNSALLAVRLHQAKILACGCFWPLPCVHAHRLGWPGIQSARLVQNSVSKESCTFIQHGNLACSGVRANWLLVNLVSTVMLALLTPHELKLGKQTLDIIAIVVSSGSLQTCAATGQGASWY